MRKVLIINITLLGHPLINRQLKMVSYRQLNMIIRVQDLLLEEQNSDAVGALLLGKCVFVCLHIYVHVRVCVHALDSKYMSGNYCLVCSLFFERYKCFAVDYRGFYRSRIQQNTGALHGIFKFLKSCIVCLHTCVNAQFEQRD